VPPPEAVPPQQSGRRRNTPRSLADELRSWPDAELVALLRARPDLAVPRPNEFATLVTRAASRAAVQRAIDGLDTAQLQVVEVLAALPEPATPTEVSRRWGAPAGPVLAQLRALALVWGTPRALRLVRAARDVLGPHPAGLGPPLADALGRRSPQRLAQLLEDLGLPPAGDPETALSRLSEHLSRADVLAGLLADAPAGVQAVLDRLTWGPPVGQVAQADRAVRRSCANGPVEWLLANGMLAVADAAHVVLPREVGLALRGGRVHRTAETEPPSLVIRPRPASAVAGTAAGAAAELVRLVEALGEQWGAAPPPVLRTGGVGVRELHRTAVALDVDDATAAFVAEVAYVAGLVADDGELDPRWAPTPAYDLWRATGTGRRWAELVAAWLPTTRCAQLVGTRDNRDTPRSALGGDLDRAAAPAVRWWVLQALAEAAVPAAPKGAEQRLAAVDPEGLRDRLDWLSPRRAGQARDTLVGWALDDAARLGVLGAGALAPHGRVLLEHATTLEHPSSLERPAALELAAKTLDAVLPQTVDHVLLQADLTAVAPGPPEPELACELALMADVESRGGATVYRFSPTSVRRALDAGRTADDVLALLTGRSRTPVPQPLSYLIGDVARRHGRVRVGGAQSFVRADDETALTALLAERRTAPLRLRRLAPTVLAAQAPAPVVLELLRELGLAPVAESPDGDIVVTRRERYRTGPRTPPRAPIRALTPLPLPIGPPPSASTQAALAAVVATVRAADRLAEQTSASGGQTPAAQTPGGRASAAQTPGGRASAPPAGDDAPAVPSGETGALIARLRAAATRQEAVWIGYTDSDGQAAPRLVQPLQVEGGQLLAVDRASQRVRTFVVHRVTGVTAATP
jgi:hypothetical protein